MKLEFKEETEKVATRQVAKYKNLELTILRDTNGLVSFHFGKASNFLISSCSIHPDKDTWRDLALRMKLNLLKLLGDVEEFLSEKIEEVEFTEQTEEGRK